MSSEAGEDLSPWWRGWYEHNWTLDMGITAASYVDHDASKGLVVTLVNKGWLLMPATLLVTATNGTTQRVTVPTETWMQGNQVSVTMPTTGPVASVVLDPDHKLPDTDRSDNRFDVHP